ncbi:aldolase [Thozetella sp. PMI_491]|nr:aldolase [Thozetella sp. PMI_491]
MAQKGFPPGVYAASLTWFSPGDDQKIDYELQSAHLVHLIGSGLTGVVVAGSNGEAVALTNEERLRLISLTREVATRMGHHDLPIIIGTVGQTTYEIIAQLRASKAAGADYGLVLTPSYFHFAMDAAAIINFFKEVADASPIPILIYSWPLVTSGIDITSDMMTVLGKHSNIVGTKLTCGGVGKTVRIAAEFKPEEFCALTGFTDWLVPGLSAGASGSISGFANLCPKTCVKIYEAYKAGKIDEARVLQSAIAAPEWALTKAGINGTKWAVAKFLGYEIESCATLQCFHLTV